MSSCIERTGACTTGSASARSTSARCAGSARLRRPVATTSASLAIGAGAVRALPGWPVAAARATAARCLQVPVAPRRSRVVDRRLRPARPRDGRAMSTSGRSTTAPRWSGCSTSGSTASSPTAPTSSRRSSSSAERGGAVTERPAARVEPCRAAAWFCYDWANSAYITTIADGPVRALPDRDRRARRVRLRRRRRRRCTENLSCWACRSRPARWCSTSSPSRRSCRRPRAARRRAPSPTASPRKTRCMAATPGSGRSSPAA